MAKAMAAETRISKKVQGRQNHKITHICYAMPASYAAAGRFGSYSTAYVLLSMEGFVGMKAPSLSL